MKKLLLVLLVVTLASFLFVGCIPVTPPAAGEGEGEGEAEICPTVAVTSQVAVAGKNYIKGGIQTVTVTFAVPTEPVSVFVGGLLKIDLTPVEIVVYANAAKTVYTGTYDFGSVNLQECGEAYIYVETCDTCDYCKYPYTVDTVGPASEIKISKAACVCEGCTIEFDSTADAVDCAVTDTCCGDDCSGFGSYAIDLYTTMPFDECCDIPCATPAYSCPGGVTCPIDCTLSCITGTTTDTDKKYYVVATLLDNVGNRTRYYATLTLDSGCGLVVQAYQQKVDGSDALCSDYETEAGSAQTVTTANPAELGLCL